MYQHFVSSAANSVSFNSEQIEILNEICSTYGKSVVIRIKKLKFFSLLGVIFLLGELNFCLCLLPSLEQNHIILMFSSGTGESKVAGRSYLLLKCLHTFYFIL